LGYLSLAAHGHADALSVTVSTGEIPLVVDPGTGSYFAGSAHVRDAFRGTAFHATVAVDDLDQSASGGPFLWLRHARSRFTAIDLAGGMAAGLHDGYEALEGRVRHRRAVHLLATGHAVVHDILEAGSAHKAAVHWPLAHDLTARLQGQQAVVTKDDDEVLWLVVAATASGVFELARGSEMPFAGWVSPRLEELVPAPRLTWRTAFTGRVDIATLLLVRPERGLRPELGLNVETDAVEISFFDGSKPVSLRSGEH
jgi:hypothetical protein